MQSAVIPTSWLESTPVPSRAGNSIGASVERGTVIAKCEPRPLSEFELDPRPEHARDAFNDRQPQSESSGDLGALIEAMKLDEDVAPF